MEWRQRIIVNSVLNDVISNVSADKDLNDIIQSGSGVEEPLPETSVFEWKLIKNNNGEDVQSKYSSRFKREQRKARFDIKHNFGAFSDLFTIENNIDTMFHKFMLKQLQKYGENDLISVNIDHDQLNLGAVFIPPFRKRDFDVNNQSFFNAIYEISQSNSTFLLNGLLTLEINITESVNGSGLEKKNLVQPPKTRDEIKKAARSIIEIKNNDKGCAFYALAVCIKRHEIPKSNLYDWQCMRRNTNKVQELFAAYLADKCGFKLSESVNIDDFKIIQNKIEKYQIIIIDGKNYRNRLFVGSPSKVNKIYLLHGSTLDSDNHFDAVINIKGIMKLKHYCEHCHRDYSEIYQHKCEFICNDCFRYPKCDTNAIIIQCQTCNFEFNGAVCYQNHLNGNNPVCRNVKKCQICLQTYYGKTHVCDLKTCKTCYDKYRLEKHYCFLKTKELKKINEEDVGEKIIIAYDIESQQRVQENNTFIHVLDLLISMTTCSVCWMEDDGQRREYCTTCGTKYRTYFGTKCIKNFCDYLYNNLAPNAAKNGAYVYIYAHNAKGYDNHFILNDLYQRNFVDVKVIMCGNKILKASVGNVKFLDSLLMFQQPLASLPKAFGFEHIVKKGFFPHNFHTEQNIDYEGDLPDEEFFGVEFMKTKQKKEFQEWHNKEKTRFELMNIKYNLKNELIEYCKNDVLILLTCVQTFRKIYKKVTGIDPITRCFTLASMGLEIFKAKILPEETIGVTPIKGYGNRGTFSKIGNCWLDFQEKVLECDIQREIPIDNFVVDGFIKEQNKIFEYNGCYYHCHDCVYTEKRDERIVKKNGVLLDKTPNEIFESTMSKIKHLKRRGFDVIEEWDCTLAKQRKTDPELNDYLKKRYTHYTLLEKFNGVDIRESFFGGRTNNIKFWCDVTDDPSSKILYYDFRSLYPTVLKYKNFPVGHPTVIRENFDTNIGNYFGFIKCIIDAPTDLNIPVLPLKNKNKKLIFPLCKTCAEKLIQKSCDHSNEERQLVGTWTTFELAYAVERGYKINKIIEVYHYAEKTNEIFSKYIDIWLKFKQQSDGWPNWVKSEEDKQEYIKNFKENEGVEMDYNEVNKNPALRFIAKLFLNTLWGKLAQRPNLKQTKVCNEYKDYWDLATDSEKIIKGELMVNEDCLLVNWEYKDDESAKNVNTSLAIASFVTSYARIELMKKIDEIEIIPGRTLYMDTDSIIFRYKEGEPKPRTDDYLGCLADEISKDYGEHAICTKFCSLGPKVYAMEIWPENSVKPCVPIKVKGITLTDTALDLINMESMIKLAKQYVEKEGDKSMCENIQIPQFQIRPTALQTIETKIFEKTFRAMSEKRRINGNDTLPYGFIDRTIEDFSNLMNI